LLLHDDLLQVGHDRLTVLNNGKIDWPTTIDQWLAFQKPLGSVSTAWRTAGPASAAYCANMSLSLINHVFIAA
jgi:hypothetical protein